MKKALGLILVTGIMAACSSPVDPEIEPSIKQTFSPSQGSDFSNCDSLPSSGELFKKTTPNFKRTDLLNKPYSANNLEGFLTASAHSLVQHLINQDVLIYKAPDVSKNNCLFFTELETAPKKYIDHWRRQKQKLHPRSSEALMGLFIAQYHKIGPKVSLGTKAIVLNEGARRWHLIHEIMHFEFSKNRKLNAKIGFPTDLTKQHKKNRKRRRKIFNRRNNGKKIFKKMLNLLKKDFRLSKEVHSRGALEEFIIEALLIDAYSQGRIPDGSPGLALASYSYLNSHYLKARPTYSGLLQTAEGMLSHTATNNDYQKLQEFILRLQEFLDTMDQMRSKAYGQSRVHL